MESISKSSLLDLPVELIYEVSSHLPVESHNRRDKLNYARDVYRLSTTCHFLHSLFYSEAVYRYHRQLLYDTPYWLLNAIKSEQGYEPFGIVGFNGKRLIQDSTDEQKALEDVSMIPLIRSQPLTLMVMEVNYSRWIPNRVVETYHFIFDDKIRPEAYLQKNLDIKRVSWSTLSSKIIQELYVQFDKRFNERFKCPECLGEGELVWEERGYPETDDSEEEYYYDDGVPYYIVELDPVRSKEDIMTRYNDIEDIVASEICCPWCDSYEAAVLSHGFGANEL